MEKIDKADLTVAKYRNGDRCVKPDTLLRNFGSSPHGQFVFNPPPTISVRWMPGVLCWLPRLHRLSDGLLTTYITAWGLSTDHGVERVRPVKGN